MTITSMYVPAVTREKFHKLRFGRLFIFPIFFLLVLQQGKTSTKGFPKVLLCSTGTQWSTGCLCFISEFLFLLLILKPEQIRTFVAWAIVKVRCKVYLTNRSLSSWLCWGFLFHLLHWPGFALLRLTLERWYYGKWAIKTSWMQSTFEDMQLLLFIKVIKPNTYYAFCC